MKVEKFYEITDESPYKAKFIEKEANVNTWFKYVEDFAKEYSIEGELATRGNDIVIKPTESNLVRFGTQMTSQSYDGYRKFRAKSKMDKAWHGKISAIVDQTRDIYWAMVFRSFGRSSSLAFEYNGKVYLQLITEGPQETQDKGFIEILGSTFHAARESKQAELEAAKGMAI